MRYCTGTCNINRRPSTISFTSNFPLFLKRRRLWLKEIERKRDTAQAMRLMFEMGHHSSAIVFLILLQHIVVVSAIVIQPKGASVDSRIQQGTTPSKILMNLEEDSALDVKKAKDDSSQQHLIFPGGGIFFYWQAGVVTYLREQKYDLSPCTFAGASAGALTATLTAADVDFYEATDLALSLAAKANVWDRSSGLQGIWGPMIYQWLDELLPPSSIDKLDEGRLSLLVTPIPSFGKNQISTFACKEDLLRCNLASVHIVSIFSVFIMSLSSKIPFSILIIPQFQMGQPWFMDSKLTYSFRDGQCIDGSFLSSAKDYMPPKTSAPNNRRSRTLVLDWSNDPVMECRGGLDIVEALSPEGIWGLIEQGKKHAKILEERGKFKKLRIKV